MPACPASFFTIPDKQERFPTSGNDTTCAIIYDAVYKINTFLNFTFSFLILNIRENIYEGYLKRGC